MKNFTLDLASLRYDFAVPDRVIMEEPDF